MGELRGHTNISKTRAVNAGTASPKIHIVNQIESLKPIQHTPKNVSSGCMNDAYISRRTKNNATQNLKDIKHTFLPDDPCFNDRDNSL